MQFTVGIMDQIEKIVQSYPEIKAYSRVVGHSMTGGSGSSSGMLIIQLKDWSERKGDEHSSTAIMNRLNQDMQQVTEASVFVMAPSMIDGYGTGNAVELYLQDKKGGDINDFYDVAQNFLSALNQRPGSHVRFQFFQGGLRAIRGGRGCGKVQTGRSLSF